MLQPPPTRANRGIVTPEPVYDPSCETCAAPGRLSIADFNACRRALANARQQYPGPAGEILAGEINAYLNMGWLADTRSPIRRLISQLNY